MLVIEVVWPGAHGHERGSVIASRHCQFDGRERVLVRLGRVTSASGSPTGFESPVRPGHAELISKSERVIGRCDRLSGLVLVAQQKRGVGEEIDEASSGMCLENRSRVGEYCVRLESSPGIAERSSPMGRQ